MGAIHRDGFCHHPGADGTLCGIPATEVFRHIAGRCRMPLCPECDRLAKEVAAQSKRPNPRLDRLALARFASALTVPRGQRPEAVAARLLREAAAMIVLQDPSDRLLLLALHAGAEALEASESDR